MVDGSYQGVVTGTPFFYSVLKAAVKLPVRAEPVEIAIEILIRKLHLAISHTAIAIEDTVGKPIRTTEAILWPNHIAAYNFLLPIIGHARTERQRVAELITGPALV